MIIVLIGAPGAGKGTQGRLLSQALSLPLISTGSILREISKDDNPFGFQIRNVISSGQLASDHVLADIVRQRTTEEDCARGYILDGHPRSRNHAEWLDDWSKEQQKQLVAVFFEVPYEELTRRLSLRKICQSCGKVFGAEVELFAGGHNCDSCEGRLTSRVDDVPSVIGSRLDVFEKMTAPLLQFYREKNQLVAIDGQGSIDEVFGRLCEALGLTSSY